MMDTLIAPLMLFALFSGVFYFVFQPFLETKVIATGDEEETATIALELRKINLYKQIREVEFEQQMGIVDESDFARIRSDLMDEVATVMQAAKAPAERSTGAGDEAGVALSVSKGSAAVTDAVAETCPSCGADTDPEGRFCSHCGTQLGAGCPNCGVRVQPQDHFCGHCGRGLVSST